MLETFPRKLNLKCVSLLFLTYSLPPPDILDTRDKSLCTPLWYSLAFRFWKLAEYMIVNGAKGLTHRFVK